MTQDIGSDAHKRPSQPEIKMAVMEERIKEARERDRTILAKLDTVLEEQARQGTMLALGNQRFDAIEEVQEDTTARLVVVENDKRGPVAIIMATLTAIGSGIVAWFK